MDSNFKEFLPVIDKVIISSLFIFTAFCMFSISITQIAAGIGGIAWCFRTYIMGDLRKQYWPLLIPFFLYSLACIIAVIVAYDTSYAYKELRKLLEILIFFWVVNCVRENHLRNSLSMLLITAAVLASLYGFYQGWRDGVNISNRVEGTMSVYMTFSGVLMMVAMFALGRVLFRKPRELWLWIGIGLFSTCLLLTFTRQAWLGFLIGGLYLLFILKRKLILILMTTLLTVLIIFGGQIRLKIIDMTTPLKITVNDKGEKIKIRTDLIVDQFDKNKFIPHLKSRINSTLSGKQDETFLMRVSLWRVGWEVFKDYPFTGCGFKCMDLIHQQYPDPSGTIQRLRGMHNNLMQLAMDTGILGLSAWIGIWVCFFGLLYKRIKYKKNQSEEWVVYGSCASSIAFLVGGCFESNFYDSEVVMLLYFIMALPFSAPKTSPPLPSQPLA
jgi:putative inorganic carbon (hco3(-)) transporter